MCDKSCKPSSNCRDRMKEEDSKRPDVEENEREVERMLAETSIEDVLKINSLEDLIAIVKADAGIVNDHLPPELAGGAGPMSPSSVGGKGGSIRSPVIGS